MIRFGRSNTGLNLGIRSMEGGLFSVATSCLEFTGLSIYYLVMSRIINSFHCSGLKPISPFGIGSHRCLDALRTRSET